MLKLDQIQQYAMGRRGTYTAWGIAAIFALLILWTLYNSMAALLTDSSGPRRTESTALNQAAPLKSLSSLHIFGLYQPANLNPNQLPKSTLNIQLNGVFVAAPPAKSQAVLTVPGQKQKIYYEGDELPENAKLYRILDNSVIIQYDGELQNLSLPESRFKFGTQPESLHLPSSTNRSNP